RPAQRRAAGHARRPRVLGPAAAAQPAGPAGAGIGICASASLRAASAIGRAIRADGAGPHRTTAGSGPGHAAGSAHSPPPRPPPPPLPAAGPELALHASLKTVVTSGLDFLDRKDSLYQQGLSLSLARYNFGPLLNSTVSYLWSEGEHVPPTEALAATLGATQ